MSVIKPIPGDMGIVEWQIADKCNYHCDYCSTKIWQRCYSPLIDYKKFLRELYVNLNGKWLIQLGGYGEPFTVPNFLKIVNELVDRGYFIGLVTNFSYPLKSITEFCKIAGRKLLYFNASLHYQSIDYKLFIRKVIKVNKLINQKIEVSIVTGKERINDIIEIYRILRENNINTVIQAEKVFGRYAGYTDKEKKELLKLSENIYGINVKNNFKGAMCQAGQNYFVLENNGDAFICHPYKINFQNTKDINISHGYLGNILKNTFSLGKSTNKCNLNNCFCSTPWRAKAWKNLPKKQ